MQDFIGFNIAPWDFDWEDDKLATLLQALAPMALRCGGTWWVRVRLFCHARRAPSSATLAACPAAVPGSSGARGNVCNVLQDSS